MMYRSISLDAVVKEWIEDYSRSDVELPEQLVYRWASSAAKMVPVDTQLKHRIGYIPIRNYKGELPEDLRIVQMVVARTIPDNPKTSRREKLVSWTQHTMDSDMDLEINLVCRSCKKNQCSCSSPVIEIDVDRVWEMANPQAYLKRWTRGGVIGEGSGTERGHNGWNILRYAQGDFYRMKHFLSDCPNLTVGTDYESFSLNLPYIETSFAEGEVIISYLGTDLDENGDVMIPDNEDLIEGIKAHLNFKWADRMFYTTIGSTRTDKNAYRAAKADAKMQREESFRLYRSAAQVPEFHDFRNWVQRFWMQRFPDHNWVEHGREGRNVGTYERYSRLIDKGYPNRTTY
jgi:hypothetical protein